MCVSELTCAQCCRVTENSAALPKTFTAVVCQVLRYGPVAAQYYQLELICQTADHLKLLADQFFFKILQWFLWQFSVLLWTLFGGLKFCQARLVFRKNSLTLTLFSCSHFFFCAYIIWFLLALLLCTFHLQPLLLYWFIYNLFCYTDFTYNLFCIALIFHLQPLLLWRCVGLLGLLGQPPHPRPHPNSLGINLGVPLWLVSSKARVSAEIRWPWYTSFYSRSLTRTDITHAASGSTLAQPPTTNSYFTTNFDSRNH